MQRMVRKAADLKDLSKEKDKINMNQFRSTDHIWIHHLQPKGNEDLENDGDIHKQIKSQHWQFWTVVERLKDIYRDKIEKQMNN